MKDAVEQLLPLVRRKASLAAAEKAFKASCKAKRVQLEHEIEDLRVNPPEPEADGCSQELEAALKAALAERDELKKVSPDLFLDSSPLKRALDKSESAGC